MPETARNLLGRMPLEDMGADIAPEPRIQEFPWPTRLPTASDGAGLRGTSPIGKGAGCIPSVLAAQGTRRSSQDGGHRAEGLPLEQPEAQGLTFFKTQMRIRFLVHGNTLVDYDWKCCTWS